MQRLAYSLAAGFLGRLCLSGEIGQLNEEQWGLVQEALYFYEQVAPIIKNGRSRLVQQIGAAWRYPQGTQAVVRISEDGRQALTVVHTFAAPLPNEIIVSLPPGDWQAAGVFPGTTNPSQINANQLRIKPSGEFEGFVLHLNGGKGN